MEKGLPVHRVFFLLPYNMMFLWTTIHVSNMEKSLEFYTKVLNLKIDRKYSPAPHMELAFLGDGETKVELIRDNTEGAVNLEAPVSMGFRTDSLDKKMEELESMGIPVAEGPFQPTPNIRFFYVKDPDGMKIQFVEQKS